MASKSILGLFEQEGQAADAMDGLNEAGFEQGTYDVLTGTPYPEGAFGEHVPQHRLFRFPLFGSLIGFFLALTFTAGTQLAYPLVTGGKPILSVFAMLVIMYEMTMLGAVLAAVAGIVFESRLPKFNMGAYDTRITAGYIGVVVSTDDTERARQVFTSNGATDIKVA